MEIADGIMMLEIPEHYILPVLTWKMSFAIMEVSTWIIPISAFLN